MNGAEFATIFNQLGGIPRQFARVMVDTIVNFAYWLDQLGNLARQMMLNFPNLSVEDSYWCSNFQSKNLNCPELVQNCLKENYNKRFGN